MRIFITIVASFIFLLITKAPVHAGNSLDVVISEVGWSGTTANTADEWIELYNNTSNPIDLIGWTLVASDGSPNITLSGTIAGSSYFLLERTDDATISDIAADKIYTGALGDTGESLQLKDATGNPIDSANADGGAWSGGTGGTGTPPRASMERIGLNSSDNDSNWTTNNGITRNGLDANSNPINGTPKAANSQGISPTPTPSPTLIPTSSPTNTPTPTKTPTPTPTKTSTGGTSQSSTPTPTKMSTPPPTLIKKSQATPKIEESSSAGETGLVLSQNIASESPTPTPEVLTAGFAETNLAKILIILGGLFLTSCGIVFAKWRKEISN